MLPACLLVGSLLIILLCIKICCARFICLFFIGTDAACLPTGWFAINHSSVYQKFLCSFHIFSLALEMCPEMLISSDFFIPYKNIKAISIEMAFG